MGIYSSMSPRARKAWEEIDAYRHKRDKKRRCKECRKLWKKGKCR